MRADNVLNVRLRGVDLGNLLTVLRQVQEAKCGDLRDRLFALQRQLSNEDIEIDYSKSFERVHADWAWKKIQLLQSLDVFSVCADSAGTSNGEQSPVPSWTPDLRFHIGRDNSLFFQTHQLPNVLQNKK